jgi:hypothetical protein
MLIVLTQPERSRGGLRKAGVCPMKKDHLSDAEV